MAAPPEFADALKWWIGDICIKWAHLEDACMQMLQYIMSAELSAFDILRNEIDIRLALRVCKAHAIGNNWGPHCPYTVKVCDAIDAHIRPYRNRLVHD